MKGLGWLRCDRGLRDSAELTWDAIAHFLRFYVRGTPTSVLSLIPFGYQCKGANSGIIRRVRRTLSIHQVARGQNLKCV